MKSSTLTAPKTETATDPLAELRAALRNYDAANSAFIRFKTTLNSAWIAFDSLLRYTSGHCADLRECLAKNLAHGIPAPGDKASFDATLANALEAQQRNDELSQDLGVALMELESALREKALAHSGNIFTHREAIIGQVKEVLALFCEYPGDADRIAAELWHVRILESNGNNFSRANAVSQARMVLTDWAKYAPEESA